MSSIKNMLLSYYIDINSSYLCESTSTILKELKDGIVVVKVYLKQ